MLGVQLYGMTCPLLVNSEGQKMGKTERGAVWLDPERTSPYEFYQYFINVADADVMNVIKLLSDIGYDECRELESLPPERAHERIAQRRLAESMTKLVHGEMGLAAAKRASEILFGGEIEGLNERELNSIFQDVPNTTIALQELTGRTCNLIDSLVTAGLCKSKSEARRSLEAGSIYVNNRRESSIERVFSEQDLVAGNAIVLRNGRRNTQSSVSCELR